MLMIHPLHAGKSCVKTDLHKHALSVQALWDRLDALFQKVLPVQVRADPQSSALTSSVFFCLHQGVKQQSLISCRSVCALRWAWAMHESPPCLNGDVLLTATAKGLELLPLQKYMGHVKNQRWCEFPCSPLFSHFLQMCKNVYFWHLQSSVEVWPMGQKSVGLTKWDRQTSTSCASLPLENWLKKGLTGTMAFTWPVFKNLQSHSPQGINTTA